MTALNLRKRLNAVSIIIIAIASILFLLSSCGGGGGGGGGGVAAPSSDEESTGTTSSSSTSSPAAPAVTETARYTVNGITYIIMSNGTVSAANADGSARTITYSASGSTYTIIDADKTLVIAMDSNGTAAITVTDSGTGAIQTLYATNGGTATAVTRTISFVTNGGTAVDNIEVPDSNTAVLPNASGKSTWNFYKWYTDSGLTTPYNTSAPVTGNMTLYAVWARNYTIEGVTYSVLSNGKVIRASDGAELGTAAEPFNSVSFTDGAKTITITVSGSTTTATVTEGGNTRTFADNGSGGLSAVMRTVTFDSKGGSNVTPVTVADGSGITAPASPTKQGYTFAGWCTDSGATIAYSFGTPVTGNITLYAKWSAGSVTYTVKHLQQDVSGSGYTEVTADRQSLGGTTGAQTSAAAKTYTGFTAQSITQQTIAADSSTVIEIRYNRNSYKVKFNANGGTGTMADLSIVYGASASLTANAFAKTGCTFAGWTTAAGGTVAYINSASYTMNSTGDVTLYAVWTANSYKVKFNANGGTGTMADLSIAYGASANLTANAFAKTGCTFSGWATAAGGTVAYINSASYTMNSTSDVTLYAVWTANSYKVKFNANGGTGTMSDQSIAYGASAALTANAFTRTGYTFAGWATSAGGTKAFNNSASYTMNSTSDVTLYAVWTINTYKVAFNANGGTGSMSQQSFTYGTAQALTVNAFTRSGYAFVGWSTTKNGAKEYNDKESVSNLSSTNGATVTLYAKWWNTSGFVKVAGNGSVETLWVCDHEVTQGEYESYCTYGGGASKTPSDTYGKGSSYPAYYVSWYDALVYCNKRSIAEGLTPCYTKNGSTDPADWGSVPTSSNATWNAVTVNSSANGYRLPTEAEWEYAAKGGNSPQSFTYSGSNDIDEVAWYSGNSESKTHPVKGKKKNTLGIYDMSGNVWEWCFDEYNSGMKRRARGGCWLNGASGSTVSSLSGSYPYGRGSDVGFRVVRNAN